MKGLHGWMRVLEGNEAAVLSTLLKELDRVTASDESSAMQLADLILKDASLTSTVIRVANSVTFNPSNISVTTVSRAILNIGFKKIRSLCLSIKVLEAVLKESPSPLLVSMLARSLHGASQAKALCSKLPLPQQEEVFVASLLSHLAELLILGRNDDEVTLLKAHLEYSSTDEEKNHYAEKYLGVSLSRLSKTLMKQWRIEGLVNDVLSGKNFVNAQVNESRMIEAVNIGGEISRASILGWDSIDFKEILIRVSEFSDISVKDAKKMVIATADETAQVIAGYGTKLLSDHIPTSKKPSCADNRFKGSRKKLLEPDDEYQLNVLQQMSEIMLAKFNINIVFKTILKGINQGVGLERVSLAIFDKSHLKVATKYISGEGTELWIEKFVVNYERSRSSFLYKLFEHDQIVWIGHDDYVEFSQCGISDFQGITGQNSFFIAPLMTENRRIGFIYADMGESSRDLSPQYFDGFKRFIQQVKLALTVLASHQKK